MLSVTASPGARIVLLAAIGVSSGLAIGRVAVASSAPTTISTGPARGIGHTVADIKVTLTTTQNGQWQLQYGRTRAYGREIGFGFSPQRPVTMDEQLQHLTPGTTYHYRAIARTPSFPPYTATYVSPDRTFTTVAGTRPTLRIVRAVAHRGCACISVRIGIRQGGYATRYFSEYGKTTGLGSRSDVTLLPAALDAGPVEVAQDFDIPGKGGLDYGTYYYRIVAVNVRGRTTTPIRAATVLPN